ncbi:MAG: hypothetical protein WBI82_03920 [Sphaerochaeta sp.]
MSNKGRCHGTFGPQRGKGHFVAVALDSLAFLPTPSNERYQYPRASPGKRRRCLLSQHSLGNGIMVTLVLLSLRWGMTAMAILGTLKRRDDKMHYLHPWGKPLEIAHLPHILIKVGHHLLYLDKHVRKTHQECREKVESATGEPYKHHFLSPISLLPVALEFIT